MKRTNIHFTEEIRDGMATVAEVRGTKPAAEYREAAMNHIKKLPQFKKIRRAKR